MQKRYQVKVARRADIMLLSHTEFLAQVSSMAARKLLAEYKKTVSQIADDPYRFPYADELDAPGIPLETYRKCTFYRRYKALFLVDGSDVHIDAIIDCRQENKGLFR